MNKCDTYLDDLILGLQLGNFLNTYLLKSVRTKTIKKSEKNSETDRVGKTM